VRLFPDIYISFEMPDVSEIMSGVVFSSIVCDILLIAFIAREHGIPLGFFNGVFLTFFVVGLVYYKSWIINEILTSDDVDWGLKI
jgi:hypothetical protein